MLRIFALLLFLVACSPPRYPQGEALYKHYCASCHMDDGSGLVALFPPLIDADYFREHRADFACIVRYGIDHPIRVNDVQFTTPMEGIARINEVEIANIFNYIQSTWYPELSVLSEKDVKQQLLRCSSAAQ